MSVSVVTMRSVLWRMTYWRGFGMIRSSVVSGRIVAKTASSARSNSSSITSAPVRVDQRTTAAGTWLSLTEACASTRAIGTYSLVMRRQPWRSSRYPKLNRARWSSLFKVSRKTSLSSAPHPRHRDGRAPQHHQSLRTLRMTTLAQGDLPRDPGILRTAAQHNHVNVGVYAAVVRDGIIRRGDPIRLE